MTTPPVSILMSVHNQAKTLPAAIDSILGQTLKEFEFIICDDASTDHTWETLCEYQKKDHRIQTFRNTCNLGLGASLNKCLKLAVGDYIARQDADDISDPRRLEKTLDYLWTSRAPYVGCGVSIFDDNGIWSQRIHPEEVTCHTIAQKNPFFHPTMVFRREVLEAVGGYRETKITRRTEDYDLVMRLAAKKIIGRNLQECLYYVYEPADAYSKHTLRTRWDEVRVRFSGLQEMRSPLWDYVYLCKPILMAIVPHKLLRQVKYLQWRR